MSYGTTSYGEVSYGEEPDSGGPILGVLSDNLTLAETTVSQWESLWTEAHTLTLAESLPIGQIIFNNFVNESVEIDDLQDLKTILSLIDAISVSDAVSAPGSFSIFAVDSATLSETVLISFSTTIAEAIELSDINVVNKGVIEALIEQLTLAEATLVTGVYNPSISDGMVVDEDTNYRFLAAVIEALELGETVTLTRYASVSESSSIELSETLINSLVYSLEAVVQMVMDETISPTQEGTAAIIESLTVSDSEEPGIQFETYVMNPENYAVSTYSLGFPESAVYGQKFLYGDSSGLYELGGTTDNGSNIQSTLVTAALDFGTSNIKQLPSVMLGTNGTDLILKVAVDQNITAHYKINERNAGLMTKHIPIGKGLLGKYWQFTLVTDNNSDLDLDTFEFYPVIFKRKRNG